MAGLEPATTRLGIEGTPGRLECQGAGNRIGIVGCEARFRTRTSWFRARRGTSSTTSQGSGREDSNLQPPASDAGALPLRHVQVSTDGRIRTDTDGGLSAVPLPRLGYVSMWVDRAGIEPATFSLQGSCASGCATGP